MLERVWIKGTLLTIGGNGSWFSHCVKQYVRFLKKLKLELPYDPAILFLDIYPDKTNSKRHMHSHIHTALFAIAKT